MLIASKNFKWHDDQALPWDIKEIKLNFQQELSNTFPNHNSKREDIMQIEALKSFSLSKHQTLLFH